MSDAAPGSLQEAQAELAAGQWTMAAEAFRRVLERDEQPDALFGIGVASFWLGETEDALRHWEQAYVAYRRGSDPTKAAIAAFYLGLAYEMSLGNVAAATGWLARASRLVDRYRIDVARGWVLLGRAHIAVDTGRPKDAEGLARDIVRLIQDRRKELGCEYTDRIEVGVVTDSTALAEAVTQFSDYIAQETLADSIASRPIGNVSSLDARLGDASLQLSVKVTNQ